MSTSFLRDASMNRLGMKLQNKKEEIMNPLSTQHLSIEKLTSSGLSIAQRSLIKKWCNGKMSGRTCLFNLMTTNGDSEPSMSESTNTNNSSTSKDSSSHVALLSRTVHLPDNVINNINNGYLYNTVFACPPRSVLRTAIGMVREKALDQVSLSSLLSPISYLLSLCYYHRYYHHRLPNISFSLSSL